MWLKYVHFVNRCHTSYMYDQQACTSCSVLYPVMRLHAACSTQWRDPRDANTAPQWVKAKLGMHVVSVIECLPNRVNGASLIFTQTGVSERNFLSARKICDNGDSLSAAERVAESASNFKFDKSLAVVPTVQFP